MSRQRLDSYRGLIIVNFIPYLTRKNSVSTKLLADYRHAVNYRPEVEPMFRSTPTSFFATLYNLNYNVPIEPDIQEQ